MPKLKKKILTKTLYAYVRPANDAWVRKNYKTAGFNSYSEFVDAIISAVRTSTTTVKTKTT